MDPYSFVADQLQSVEQRLLDCTRSKESEITEIASHLIRGGGKRIRPVITLLTFKAFHGRREEDVVDIAAAMELIHAATLLPEVQSAAPTYPSLSRCRTICCAASSGVSAVVSIVRSASSGAS